MTAKRAVAAAVLLVAMVSSLQALAQSNPYQELRKYDFQDRRAAMAIRRDIQAAGPDRAKQAPIETGLIGVIRDPSSTLAGKQEAARLLWLVAGAKSAPVLGKLLDDPAMNNIARYGLERDPDPAAAAALRGALGTAKGEALVGVINSVGNRADAAAVPALRKLAVNPDPLVSDAAIAALGKIGTTTAVKALRSLPNKGLNVFNALLRSASKLAATGNRAESLRLYESLTAASYPPVIRAGALEGLMAQGAPQTSALALSVAQTAADPTLQRVAGSVSGRLSNAADTHRAVVGFPRLPVAAQVALLAAWADRRERSAATVAMAALKSDNPDVRTAAIRAAARVGGVSAVPVLADLAAGGDQAQVARESLARMSGPGVEDALVRLLSTGKPEVRTAVVNVLAERPGAASEAALMTAASSADTPVAVAALKALGRIAAADQEPRLVAILVGAKQDEVRDAAQSAIVASSQRSGDRSRAAGPLLSAYESASTAGKAALIGALAEVGGDQALDVITKGLASPDAEIHSAALNALANTWSDPRPLPTLLRLSREGATHSDRVLALRGFIRLTGADDLEPAASRVDRIREAMSIADRPEEKRMALSVLREIRSPAAVEMAANSLDDPQLNAEAANTILYLASRQRKANRNLPPVTGPEVQSALDKVIRTASEESVREQARKLRQG